jgi:hypothetical protein
MGWGDRWGTVELVNGAVTMDLQGMVQALSAKARRWYAERGRTGCSEVLSADAPRLRRPDSPMVLGKQAPPRLPPFLAQNPTLAHRRGT